VPVAVAEHVKKVTQKTAEFMLLRIRDAFKRDDDEPPMDGPAEADEMYFGGLRKNMSNKKRTELADTGRGAVGKEAVVGVKDRGTGRVAARHVQRTDAPHVAGFVAETVKPGAKVYTDEAPSSVAAAGLTGSDMLLIGALSSAAQGASYCECDGDYVKDDPEHRDASAWIGNGAEELGPRGPVDADAFRAVLESRIPDGSDTRPGRRSTDGEITHRPGRDLTFSAPKSVSIAALVGRWAATSGSSRPTTAPWRRRSPGSRRPPPRPGSRTRRRGR